MSNRSWIADVVRTDVVSLQPQLDPRLAVLKDRVVAACPGRTGEVIDSAVRGCLGLSHAASLGDLAPGEAIVHEIAEQFVLDVHGVTDAQFDRLKEHFSQADIVALLFRMALADGLGKLEKVA